MTEARQVDGIVGEWTGRHTKQELVEILGGEIPFGPVFDAADIFADPHFKIRQMLVPTEQPGASGRIEVAGTPIHMSATPGGVRRRAPTVGEHTDQTLADFGFEAQEIERLRAAGAVH